MCDSIDIDWRPAGVTAAFSTLGCGDLGIDEVLAFARQRGIPAVELRTLGGTNDILAYLSRRFEHTDEFRTLIRGSGILVASLDTSVDAINASAADRDGLRRLLPWIEA